MLYYPAKGLNKHDSSLHMPARKGGRNGSASLAARYNERNNIMSFFKAYDMRGTFGIDFNLDLVGRVGRALPQVVGGGRWLVGRDGRESSPAVRDALVAGLRAAGAEVVDIGLATTPMVYFFTANDGYDGSVMITASHNPPSDNGLKVSRKGAMPVGYDSGLADVEKLAVGEFANWKPEQPRQTGTGEPDAATAPQHVARYAHFLRSLAPADFSNLKFAVDCSDGMASLVAHELFAGAAFINDSIDGRFPHHSPNPLKAEAREQIAQVVRERELDCGVIFDGDADRCMFVDERGRFIQPDYLIPVLAETYLPAPGDGKPPVVIHDVRTSRAAIERLRAAGFAPVMGKVGHAFAKKLLRETGGVCGGELAGHYYFRDFFHCDSGELAALRILGAFAGAKASGRKVSDFMAPISGKYANSGEMNFMVQDKKKATAAILEAAAKLGVERRRETMDGYRLEFDEGWISVRESNTEPYLRLLVETDTPARLADWTAALKPE